VLLAGFGGGCVSPDGGASKQTGGYGTVTRGKEINTYQGPNGEPVISARGAAPGGVKQAGGTSDNSGIEPALFRKWGTPAASNVKTVAYVPGMAGTPGCSTGDCGGYAAGPVMGGYPGPNPHGGILPVPGLGAPGATAGIGSMVPGMGGMGAALAGMPANGRASIKFTGPAGMKITWQLPGGGFLDEASGLTAPKEYNFVQGQTYRLRLTQVLPNHPGKSFYPTLEVASANPKALKFLAHSCVPVTFSNEDFDQAVDGNLVVKVIYLPDRDNQDFVTVAGGIEELVSTRLEPGADPVAEAQRRGTVLAIINLGNIDLENRASPAMTAPPGGGFSLPPGAMMVPPGAAMPVPAGPGGPSGALPPGRSTVSGVPASRPSGAAPSGPIAPSPVPPGSAGALGTLPPIK